MNIPNCIVLPKEPRQACNALAMHFTLSLLSPPLSVYYDPYLYTIIIVMCMFALSLSMYTAISIIIPNWHCVAQGVQASMDCPSTTFGYPLLYKISSLFIL